MYIPTYNLQDGEVLSARSNLIGSIMVPGEIKEFARYGGKRIRGRIVQGDALDFSEPLKQAQPVWFFSIHPLTWGSCTPPLMYRSIRSRSRTIVAGWRIFWSSQRAFWRMAGPFTFITFQFGLCGLAHSSNHVFTSTTG